MSGLIASAMKGALLRFQETLTLISVSTERARGHTTREESEPVQFYGAISLADEWRLWIAPGGEMSHTSPVLVIAEGAMTIPAEPEEDEEPEEPEVVAIDSNDIVENRAGVRMRVVRKINASADFGLVLFELTEEL